MSYGSKDYDAFFWRGSVSEADLDAQLGITRGGDVSMEAYDRAFGVRPAAAVDRQEDDELVAALVRAGLTEDAAARAVQTFEGGASPQSAALSETAFGTVGIGNQSLPVSLVRQRVEQVLVEAARSRPKPVDQDAGARADLRAALSAVRRRPVTEAEAEAELDKLRQEAIREGLSRIAFRGLVAQEVDRLTAIVSPRPPIKKKAAPRAGAAESRMVTIVERGSRR